MLQVSGEQGELWWISDPVDITIPLMSRDGWDWFPPDETRWWVQVVEVRESKFAIEPDCVHLPAGYITTYKCLLGEHLEADVVCHPLSLACVAPTWELHVETILSPPALGGRTETARGATGAVLRGLHPALAQDLPKAGEAFLGRLRHGQAAFQGKCWATKPDMSDSLSLLFEEVTYDPV